MTWTFVYLACLVVGLTLAVVTGLVRRIADLNGDPRVVLPTANHAAGRLRRMATHLAIGAAIFGLIGLPLSAWQLFSVSTIVLVAGSVAALILILGLLPRRRRTSRVFPSLGEVVRTIAPQGFGQVRVTQHGSRVILAARSADGGEIPAGCEVEVVDASRSVLTVRRRVPVP